MTEEALRTGLGSAELPDCGTRVSASLARMLAADAEIIPVVLGGASQPLDLGLGRRFFSEARRRAMAVRGGGCAGPGCDAPPSWCDGAHIRPAGYGPTSIDDGVLLCWRCHLLHDAHGWQLDRDEGRWWWTPPPWIDPTGRRRPAGGSHRSPPRPEDGAVPADPAVRIATDADLALLAGIEDAADRRFIERFRLDTWDAAPSGAERAAEPGFLLVAGQPPVGFAHVLEVGGGAHLEQVAVLPEAGRRGTGRVLVAEALAEAARRGHRRLTLRTYSDVPWNAPFSARLGFIESDPDTEHLRRLVLIEQQHGLDRWGRRIQMTASTDVAGPR